MRFIDNVDAALAGGCIPDIAQHLNNLVSTASAILRLKPSERGRIVELVFRCLATAPRDAGIISATIKFLWVDHTDSTEGLDEVYLNALSDVADAALADPSIMQDLDVVDMLLICTELCLFPYNERLSTALVKLGLARAGSIRRSGMDSEIVSPFLHSMYSIACVMGEKVHLLAQTDESIFALVDIMGMEVEAIDDDGNVPIVPESAHSAYIAVNLVSRFTPVNNNVDRIVAAVPADRAVTAAAAMPVLAAAVARTGITIIRRFLGIDSDDYEASLGAASWCSMVLDREMSDNLPPNADSFLFGQELAAWVNRKACSATDASRVRELDRYLAAATSLSIDHLLSDDGVLYAEACREGAHLFDAIESMLFALKRVPVLAEPDIISRISSSVYVFAGKYPPSAPPTPDATGEALWARLVPRLSWIASQRFGVDSEAYIWGIKLARLYGGGLELPADVYDEAHLAAVRARAAEAAAASSNRTMRWCCNVDCPGPNDGGWSAYIASMKRCDGCGIAWYCCRGCQQDARARGHSAVCRSSD